MKLLKLLLLWAACLLAMPASAAITCTTLTSPGWTTGYVNGTTPNTQTSFTITCTRDAASDPTTLAYSVKVNNGINNNGSNNFARLAGGTAKISYETYTTSCSNSWKQNSTVTGTVSWTTTGTSTDTRTFWLCVPSAQTLTSQGVYTDTLTLTATYNGTQSIAGQFDVVFYAPAFCNIANGPGNIQLTYPAFSANSIAQTISFATQCTTSLPYSLAISPTGGVLVGVNYQLAVADVGGGGSASCTGAQCSATGTGVNQSYSITATAPSGQPGTCSSQTCSGAQVHTLTITY